MEGKLSAGPRSLRIPSEQVSDSRTSVSLDFLELRHAEGLKEEPSELAFGPLQAFALLLSNQHLQTFFWLSLPAQI